MRIRLTLLAVFVFVGRGWAEPAPSPRASPSLSEASHLDQLLQSLDAKLATFSKSVPSQEEVQTVTKDELKKIDAWEYKVVDFENFVAQETFEKRLNELGVERWDCFDIRLHEAATRLTCKRRPQSYLRYIPRFLP